MPATGYAVKSELIESPRLARYRRASVAGGRDKLDRAWQTLVRGGLPIVERVAGRPRERRVTFVWRPGARSTSASMFTPVSEPTREAGTLRRIPRTGVFFRTVTLSDRTRALYGYSTQPHPGLSSPGAYQGYMQSIQADPYNPVKFEFDKDPDDPSDQALTLSVLQLPRAPVQPWSRVKGPSHWTETSRRVSSRFLRGTRTIWVYRPRGPPRPAARERNLVIVFDGAAYRNTIPTPRIVENLVRAGRIAPTEVVLVGNAAHRRWQELAGNPAFARFVGEELVPLLRREYGIRAPARRIVLAGSSLGALTSCFVALRYPRLFGNVLAQSGAFPWECSDPGGGKSTLMEQYARAPRHAVRFYLDAGTHERFPDPVMGVSLLWSVMHMRDVLEARGYRVHCAEFEGGHDYACWKGTLADGLIQLLGRRAGD